MSFIKREICPECGKPLFRMVIQKSSGYIHVGYYCESCKKMFDLELKTLVRRGEERVRAPAEVFARPEGIPSMAVNMNRIKAEEKETIPHMVGDMNKLRAEDPDDVWKDAMKGTDSQ